VETYFVMTDPMSVFTRTEADETLEDRLRSIFTIFSFRASLTSSRFKDRQGQHGALCSMLATASVERPVSMILQRVPIV